MQKDKGNSNSTSYNKEKKFVIERMNQDVGRDMNASKLRTNCSELAKKSYACLEQSKGGHYIY